MPAADYTFQCSLFRNKLDTKPQFRAAKWSSVVEAFITHSERTDKDGRLWSPAIYSNGSGRGNAGVEMVTAGVGDFDDGIAYEEVKERLAGYEYVAHSTFSHTAKHPKFRIIIPFAAPVPKVDFAKIKARVDEHIFKVANDQAVNDLARIYYLPSCPPGSDRFAEHHEGEWLDPYSLPESTRPVETPRPDSGERHEGSVPLGKTALDFVANGAPLGEQRVRALAAARNYLSAGYSVEDTAAAIWRGLQASPQDPDRGPWVYDDALFIADNLDKAEAPPLTEIAGKVPPRSEIHRFGMGYVCELPSMGLVITIDRLRRSGEGLRGEMSIEARLPGVPVHLHWGNVTLSSTTSRTTLSKYLKGRCDGIIDEETWKGILEDVCRKVAFAEREGEPFEEVGMLPSAAPTSYLIENMVSKFEATTLFGEGGSGKSMLALALALSVQTGVQLVPGYKPLEKGQVLYLDWETSKARLDSRVKALVEGAGLPPTQIGYRRCTSALIDQCEEVLRYCQNRGVLLIVVDSVEMAMAGTRDGGSDANDAILRLHSALRLLKTTVLLVDHVSKQDRKENGRRSPYGGIFKTNLARMEYELRRSTYTPDNGLHMVLLNTKRNDDGFCFKPFGLHLEFEFGTARYVAEQVDDPDLLKALDMRQKIKLALNRFGQATIKAVAEEIDENPDSVSVTMRRMERAKVPEVRKCGKEGKEDLWTLVPSDSL